MTDLTEHIAGHALEGTYGGWDSSRPSWYWLCTCGAKGGETEAYAQRLPTRRHATLAFAQHVAEELEKEGYAILHMPEPKRADGGHVWDTPDGGTVLATGDGAILNLPEHPIPAEDCLTIAAVLAAAADKVEELSR